MNKELLWKVLDYDRRGMMAWGKLPPELFTFEPRRRQAGQGGARHG